MPDDDDSNDDDIVRRLPRSATPEITLLAERQRSLMRRVSALEKKASEMSTLLNKGLGAAAILLAIGAGIGWLVSLGGNLLRIFKP